MCKSRFDSQGMILNGFYKKKKWKKNVNDTRDSPAPFIANVTKNLLYTFLTPSWISISTFDGFIWNLGAFQFD